MKNQTRVTLGRFLLPALAITLLCLAPLQAALPPATPAVTPSPFADELPEAWGSSARAKRPVPVEARQKPSHALVALPEPKSLSRMPVGRVEVGKGRIDPEQAMRRTAFYVIRAQAAGVVEYLYSGDGLTRAGQPLVRLYDLGILSDLKIGESAMSRFANGPFVIAPRQAGLPPLPPADFPKPTAIQRLLGIRPAPRRVAVAPQATLGPAPRADLTAQAPHSALAPANGLAALPPAPSAERKAVQSSSVRSVTRLTNELSEAHDRVSELTQSLARVDKQLDGAQEDLAAAKDDAAARERLYNQGVLARNVYESAQAKVSSLSDEVQDLQRKRSEAVHAREMATERVAALQDQLDEQVSQARSSAATLAARAEAVVRQPAHQAAVAPSPRRAAEAPAYVRRAATPRVAESFPSPTRRPRPELRRLPRSDSPRFALQSQSEIPSVPQEVKRLADPRWIDQSAPGDGLVVRQIAAPGAQVKPGQPLLEVANREWARVYSDIDPKDVANFPKGAPVRVSFDSYPGVTLEGFINSVEPVVETGLARVEMIVVAREGYCPDDTYASLEWLVLAAPLTEIDEADPLAPAVEEVASAQTSRAAYDLFPIIPPELGPAQDNAGQVKDDEYVGVLRLGEMDAQASAAKQNPVNSMRLSRLHKWRESFTSGMTTGIFGNLVLTYPRDNEIGQAVEKLATARVTHAPNRCARTMREALGWGLGDAAMWLNRLPERGYVARKDGLARPGDILVWPFTYGPRRNQHIGVAVNQNGKLMLLSNLGGTLGTAELTGGYVAFYKPAPKAPAATAKLKAAAKPTATKSRSNL
ncbi:MAG: HlyD family efflux transporter periplasmic adaptor subunit [Armatimonadia bacterium]